MNIHSDPTGIRIEAVSRLGIADLPNHLPGNGFIIHPGGRGDLAENMDFIGDGCDLTGHMGMRILFQQGIQNCIGNLVADLVRMPFRYAFRSKEGSHFVAASCFLQQLHCHRVSAVGFQFLA